MLLSESIETHFTHLPSILRLRLQISAAQTATIFIFNGYGYRCSDSEFCPSLL